MGHYFFECHACRECIGITNEPGRENPECACDVCGEDGCIRCIPHGLCAGCEEKGERSIDG
jgi:hypothetical protein